MSLLVNRQDRSLQISRWKWPPACYPARAFFILVSLVPGFRVSARLAPFIFPPNLVPSSVL